MSVKVQKDLNGPYFVFEQNNELLEVRPSFKKRFDIGGKSDLLAKSIGYKKNNQLSVLDLTAGLCRDAYHLSSIGCQVTAVEKNRELYDVLFFYVEKLKPPYSFSLLNSDSLLILQEMSEEARPDVIFYDPMFPEKQKSARSGKESELLKILCSITTPDNERDLLLLALGRCRKRVVVKRPIKAPEILSKPQIVYEGRSVRYDVYLSASKDEYQLKI